jgi:hypothetical protein
MRRRLLLALVLWVGVPKAASAAEVLAISEEGDQLTISPALGNPWKENESVCVLRGLVRVSCGFVTKSTGEGAIVQVTLATQEKPRLRDTVDRVEHTAQVYQVITDKKSAIITHAANRRWLAGDTVCLYRKNDPLGCGEVSGAQELTARAELFWSSGVSFNVGDGVREAPGKARVVKVLEGGDSIILAQTIVKPWKVGETLAVMMGPTPVAWGQVSKSYPLTVEVKILQAKDSFDEGDWVKPAALPTDVSKLKDEEAERQVAAINDAVAFRDGKREVLSAGFMSLMPTLRYERAVFPRVALGGALLVASQGLGGGSLSGLGMMATVNYYPRIFPRGFWLQMGMGFAHLGFTRGAAAETRLVPLFSATAGWKWVTPKGISVALGGGALYLTETSSPKVFLNHSGVIPTLQLDFGFVF